MRLKNTRIAFSACCGVLCLLLVGLWVKSYYYHDLLIVPVFQSLSVAGSSFEGELRGGYQSPAVTDYLSNFISDDLETRNPDLVELWRSDKAEYGFGVGTNGPGNHYTAIPHYFAVLLLALATVLPSWRWIMQGIQLIPHRFSLRTLLIAMTAVAVGLWFIMWMARR